MTGKSRSDMGTFPKSPQVGQPVAPEVRWRIQLLRDKIGRVKAAKYLRVGPVMLDDLLHPNGRVKPDIVARVRKLLDDGAQV